MMTEQERYVRRLEWALVMILDGVQEHDIRGQTGLCNDTCRKIHEIRNEVLNSRGDEAFEEPDEAKS